jgi:hypothetical protein
MYMSARLNRRPCPICRKPAVVEFRPFCSRGCRDRDLNAWFDEAYRVPVPPAADEGDEPGEDAR